MRPPGILRFNSVTYRIRSSRVVAPRTGRAQNAVVSFTSMRAPSTRGYANAVVGLALAVRCSGWPQRCTIGVFRLQWQAVRDDLPPASNAKKVVLLRPSVLEIRRWQRQDQYAKPVPWVSASFIAVSGRKDRSDWSSGSRVSHAHQPVAQSVGDA